MTFMNDLELHGKVYFICPVKCVYDMIATI